VVVFEVLFKLAAAVLLAPAVAALLAVVLAGAGRVAVTNRDLLDFLLTPAGVLYAALLGTVTVALLLLEQAGLMLVAGPARPPLRAVPRGAWRVARLGFGKLVLLALALAPFVLLAGLTYAALLTRHDLYFYWKDRPPVFWVAAGIGAVTLAAAVAAGLALCVRWAFALPILLFEGGPPGAALRASRERVRGVGWRVGAVLVGWQLAVFLAGAAAAAGFRLAAAAVLDGAGERPTGRVVLLLAAQGGLLAVVSFVAVVGHAVLTLRLYLHRNEQLGIPPPPGPAADGPASPWPRRAAWLLFAVAPVAPVLVGLDLARRLEDPRPVAVTAHRGHARAAPENTLSAIRKAIESGADYAEIDVQLTADGVPVLLHDRDLMRVAGDPRRLADLTLAEVRTLDVGRWFGPAFAGERVPTLAEVVDLARGRIRLNVELKSPGPDPRLARAVADLVRDLGVEADTLLTSFHPADLAEVRGHNPRVRTGLIVAHAVGDVSRLDVDVLNVRADHLTDELIGEAHRRGREVHVWTVNDPREMARFIKRGADNILTSDPDALVRVRDEWAGVTGPERLVLASRVLFGLEP
jgi:glycerophosphoryl diester phosphodiesterase